MVFAYRPLIVGIGSHLFLHCTIALDMCNKLLAISGKHWVTLGGVFFFFLTFNSFWEKERLEDFIKMLYILQ